METLSDVSTVLKYLKSLKYSIYNNIKQTEAVNPHIWDVSVQILRQQLFSLLVDVFIFLID